MLARRQFVALLVLGGMAVPARSSATRRRPSLTVTVHDNHPLHVTIRDEVSGSRSAVWHALRHTDQWEQWVPLVARSDVVRGPTGSPALAATIDLPWPVSDRYFVATKRAISVGQVDRLTLEYVPNSGNLRGLSAEVFLRRLSDRKTEVVARVMVDFGLRLTKGFIRWLLERKTPEAFEALERRIATHG